MAYLDRRGFLVTSAGMLGAAALPGCKQNTGEIGATPPVPMPTAAVVTTTVRVASVPTAVEGNLLPRLVEEFHKTPLFASS